MEIIKHLYDIARLFEEIDNLQTTSKFFSQIAEVELSYRGLDNSPKLIFDDIRQTSLCIATRVVEGNGDFGMLQRGINRIKAFMFRGGYMIENTIVDATRAAYIATLLEMDQTKIDKYNGDPQSITELEIRPTLTNRLNKLKRQSPGAFYYWAKVSELL